MVTDHQPKEKWLNTLSKFSLSKLKPYLYDKSRKNISQYFNIIMPQIRFFGGNVI